MRLSPVETSLCHWVPPRGWCGPCGRAFPLICCLVGALPTKRTSEITLRRGSSG
ncbi:hypothetical protein HMPREF0183_0074 [Brevibacterium mcbrellneri ATCC 49030]|uniref:Uncharacterized protein n=1 Tax=Brevibacterium mcbrellneri ATCC 49030 TaxID=585530 RepID=D4YJG4_9MICO|nr:hypothetical protein HMPREF0183_0074 [Brevibacterium mcbrellneri ATCC 49030]